MSTIEITLPDDVKALADEQVASGRFRSHSDYVRSLIEADKHRQAVEATLLSRLGEDGLVEMDSADIGAMRQEFLRRQASRRGGA